MDASIHAHVVSTYIQDRMAEATAERAARTAEPRRRRLRRKHEPTVVADLSRPVTSKLPTVTPS
jgi:hypothetical protein